MHNNKVSVIIPIYNAQKYLKQCLDSVINQSHQELEIICVNDGSTDGCAEIIEDYAKQDSRVVVITQENQGLSGARNSGLEKASGEYVVFVDADDFLEVTFVEVLLENMLKFDSQIAIESVWEYDDVSKQRVDNPSAYFTLSWMPSSLVGQTFTYKDVMNNFFMMPVMAWSKMYRLDFLKSLGAKFPQGLVYEDNPFFFEIFLNAQRVSVDRCKLYNYRVNVDGSITKKTGKNYSDMFEIMNRIEDILKKNSVYEDLKDDFLAYKVRHITKLIVNIDSKEEKNCFNRMQREFLNMEMTYKAEAMLANQPLYALYTSVRNDTYLAYKFRRMCRSLI